MCVTNNYLNRLFHFRTNARRKYFHRTVSFLRN